MDTNINSLRYEIKELHKLLEREAVIKENIKELANTITPDDFLKLDYQECKSILQEIQYFITNKDVRKSFEEIIFNKKAELYPEILDVHYYPEIKELKQLSKEEQITLDIFLKECSRGMRRAHVKTLKEYDKKIIQFLIDKNILDKIYSISCKCGSTDCSERHFNESEINKYKAYWAKSDTERTDEEDDELNYGSIYMDCWNGGEYEIVDLLSFENAPKRVSFRVIKKPDLTLDEL